MKFIICGGREYTDRETLFSALDRLHAKVSITLIIEGGAPGADRLAREWALSRGMPFRTVEAEWNAHGRKAGPLRNAKMLELLPDGIVAFPGGKGTANMIKQALLADVKVWQPRT